MSKDAIRAGKAIVVVTVIAMIAVIVILVFT